MVTLVIETSSERGIVALHEAKGVLFEEQLPHGLRNSSHLIPAVQRGLDALHMTCQDLECIAVGVGPGSYTGIRVGAMVAKTLAWSEHLPLVGLSSLKCFIPEGDSSFAVLVDAKVSGVFMIKGVIQSGKVRYLSEPQVFPVSAMDQELTEIKTVVSPHREAIQRRWEGKGIQWEEVPPHPAHMAEQAQILKDAGECTFDGSLELRYLREWG